MRVLLVEDDEMIGQAIVLALRDQDYAADWVREGATATVALTPQEHDAVLLDLNLPDQDGLSVLHQLRSSGNAIPVVVLTARDGVDDHTNALRLGANDYLVKPFDLEDMFARLRAVTRRGDGEVARVITNGVLALDTTTHQARLGSTECHLSSREYALLRALLLRPGLILSRSTLEGKIYSRSEEAESNAVECLIDKIRSKLGASAILTIRGVGWMVDNAQPFP